jgi:general secretion pathway protein A
MYQRFYGLREMPFELTPNPRFLLLTDRHREALSNLQYGLSAAKPITLLLGEAGTGKTTLLRAALESDLCRNVRGVHLTNPALTRDEFVTTLAQRFELGRRAESSKAELIDGLERVLRERRENGQITALVVDEAQSMSDALLEELRLLANTETTTEKLLPVVLAGQPELRDRLNSPRLTQLKQRIALRCEIAPFSLAETAAYIAARVRIAGGDAVTLFTRDAVMLIHERSRGIPRTISAVCDNALLSGFALRRRPVDREIIREVSRDFDLGEVAASAGSAAETVAGAPVERALRAVEPEPPLPVSIRNEPELFRDVQERDRRSSLEAPGFRVRLKRLAGL